jgi:hypothetical protein
MPIRNTPVLNLQLYNVITNVFPGEVLISNEDQPGRYSLPQGKASAYKQCKGMLEYAQVEDWGEVYHCDCPVCGDTRKRLYISHLFGSRIIPKGKKTPIAFSKRLVVCHNEGCQSKHAFSPYLQAITEGLDKNEPVLIQEGKEVVKQAFSGFTVSKESEIRLPKGCLSLCSDNMPKGILTALLDRRFDLHELDTEYFIRYAPAGVTWTEKGVDKTFYDDRLLIPIIQERRLVSWQARTILHSEGKKYINYGDARKSNFLYNMDRALMYPHMVICEGVTDAWRVGPNAVALFGKTVSMQQVEIMKDLWGFDGSCVIALDSDAIESAEKIAWLLKAEKVFPKGVAILRLAEGDPDEHSRAEITEKIREVRMRELGIDV